VFTKPVATTATTTTRAGCGCCNELNQLGS